MIKSHRVCSIYHNGSIYIKSIKSFANNIHAICSSLSAVTAAVVVTFNFLRVCCVRMIFNYGWHIFKSRFESKFKKTC